MLDPTGAMGMSSVLVTYYPLLLMLLILFSLFISHYDIPFLYLFLLILLSLSLFISSGQAPPIRMCVHMESFIVDCVGISKTLPVS